MNMGNNAQELRGFGGGGGGSRDSNGSEGSSGGSGGGTSQPVDDSVEISGGTTSQGNTLWNGTSYISGGSNGIDNPANNGLISGTGGGGASGNIFESDGSIYEITNGMAGINIPINGGVLVAAGGGAAQYCHDTTIHTLPNSSYGVGGSAIGGLGSVYKSTTDGIRDDNSDEAGYERKQTSGKANTGSGGGGRGYTQGNDPVNDLAGNGGNGIVIIYVKSSSDSKSKNYLLFNKTRELRGLSIEVFDVNDNNVTFAPNDKLYLRSYENNVVQARYIRFDGEYVSGQGLGVGLRFSSQFS